MICALCVITLSDSLPHLDDRSACHSPAYSGTCGLTPIGARRAISTSIPYQLFFSLSSSTSHLTSHTKDEPTGIIELQRGRAPLPTRSDGQLVVIASHVADRECPMIRLCLIDMFPLPLVYQTRWRMEDERDRAVSSCDERVHAA